MRKRLVGNLNVLQIIEGLSRSTPKFVGETQRGQMDDDVGMTPYLIPIFRHAMDPINRNIIRSDNIESDCAVIV